MNLSGAAVVASAMFMDRAHMGRSMGEGRSEGAGERRERLRGEGLAADSGVAALSGAAVAALSVAEAATGGISAGTGAAVGRLLHHMAPKMSANTIAKAARPCFSPWVMIYIKRR